MSMLQVYIKEKTKTQGFILNTVRSQKTIMTERMVEIPVNRNVREKIKKIKGDVSYSQFISDLLELT